MVGDKPDPRLRTPMQWSAGRGLGFTTGKAWESAQPDSLTTTVAAQDADSSSLLNLYRRLIHLRRQNAALAGGTLVALAADNPHVAAYLRRAGDQVVLVIANLGDVPATRPVISAADSVLPPGRYAARNLLGGPNGLRLEIKPGGRMAGYEPVRALAPRASLVLYLSSTTAP